MFSGFSDNRHMNLARLPALRTGRPYFSRVSRTQDYTAAGKIKSMKNLKQSIRIFFCILLFPVLYPYLSLPCFLVPIVLHFTFFSFTYNTQHKHSCPRRNSNPESQQEISRRPLHYTARPMGLAESAPPSIFVCVYWKMLPAGVFMRIGEW
jgi:hypothetical protein